MSLFFRCLHIWISFPGFPKAYFLSLMRTSSKCGSRSILCEKKLMAWVRTCLSGGRQAPNCSSLRVPVGPTGVKAGEQMPLAFLSSGLVEWLWQLGTDSGTAVTQADCVEPCMRSCCPCWGHVLSNVGRREITK